MQLKSIFTSVLAAALSIGAVRADNAIAYERLSVNDTVLLIVDLQVGLASLVGDWDATVFRSNMFAHAALGPMFNLDTVMATSVSNGPNGPLPKEILAMHADAPLINRPGEVNAWDNADFRAAVRATNKTQVVLAGIATDVCVTFLALSLRAEGYHVVVNAEASGTFNPRVAEYAINRMQAAGVQVMNFFSIFNELFRDWRNTDPSAAKIFPYLDQYQPQLGWVVRSHAAALTNSTLMGGEMETITVNKTQMAMCIDP